MNLAAASTMAQQRDRRSCTLMFMSFLAARVTQPIRGEACVGFCRKRGRLGGGAKKDIAAKFVELYWQQSRPFQVGNQPTGLILQQNTGRQAAIISKIVDSQQKC